MSFCLCPVPHCRGKAFNSQQALTRHMKDCHPNDKKSQEYDSFVETNTYQDGVMLTTIKSNSFDDDDSSHTYSSSFSKSYVDSTTWECTICNESFYDKNDLSDHAKSCVYSDLLYQCDDCEQKFKYLSSLYEHVDETKCNHEKSVSKSLTNVPVLNNGSIYEATLYFDGAAIPNPGNGGAGFQLIDSYGRLLEEHSISVLKANCTKDEAVYCALIRGLQCAAKHNISALLAHSDSELVINQMAGHYFPSDKQMMSIHHFASRTGSAIKILDYQWIPERRNSEADALAKQGSRRQGDQQQATLIA